MKKFSEISDISKFSTWPFLTDKVVTEANVSMLSTVDDTIFFFLYSSKILQNILHLHPTILSNYYTNYTNTTGTGPQGANTIGMPTAVQHMTQGGIHVTWTPEI